MTDFRAYYRAREGQRSLDAFVLGARVARHQALDGEDQLEILRQIRDGELTLAATDAVPGPGPDGRRLLAGAINRAIRSDRESAGLVLAAIDRAERDDDFVDDGSADPPLGLDERRLRRPDFRGGRPVVMADGRPWSVPTGAAPSLAPLVAAYAGAERSGAGAVELLEMQVEIAAEMLRLNYDLDAVSIAGLLGWSGGDDAAAESIGEILFLAGWAGRDHVGA